MLVFYTMVSFLLVNIRVVKMGRQVRYRKREGICLNNKLSIKNAKIEKAWKNIMDGQVKKKYITKTKSTMIYIFYLNVKITMILVLLMLHHCC